MYRHLIASALVASALGCAMPRGGAANNNNSTGPAQVTVLGPDGKPDMDKSYICEMENDVGSHMPQRNCRTLRQIEADRIAAGDVGVVPTAGQAGQGTKAGR